MFLTCHKNEKMLQEFCSQLEEKYSVSCAAFAGDIGDADQTEQLFTMIEEKRGRLDVLVNNAGISWHGLLTDMTPDEWNTMINTNLSSVFYTSRLAIPLMLKRHRGKIINISSVWGCVGASCETAYSAAKGGVNAFTQALAKELAPSNIQVNAIACGAIDTEMNGFLLPEERRELEEEIPTGRFGTPAEVAKLTLSLCGGNEYLTGQIIRLDGGWI